MYQLYNGGDIQRLSDKLPGLPWAKYSDEKHLIIVLLAWDSIRFTVKF